MAHVPTLLSDLAPAPIWQAPMAGGGSRPQLAAAVCEAGGLGFLAAGYKTPEAMYEEVRQLRAATDRPFGVNLFMPQPPAVTDGALAGYAEQLAGETTWYRTQLGEAEPEDADYSDAFEAKVALLKENPVAAVSFTFGCPDRSVLDALAALGTLTVVTVTSAEEAARAAHAGAGALCVQGAEAGGHQGSFRDEPRADGTERGLLTLLAEVREAVRLPLIATGGLMRGAQIAAVLAAGAEAAQLGTAFLVCPESGANVIHKRAILEGVFTRTELSRAFTGRRARGLVNRFVREHGPYAPAAYPQVHWMTGPLRTAAAAAGDPHGMALWAGQGHRLARDLPAGELVGVLTEELRIALGDSPSAQEVTP
ncbi:nitronate monooxygenase [Streptomyces sp. NPDC051940]|uniref:nitronate monooxygenase n=1 Tax=Streptomyces sp. NPDC051940 TaxID=3155675 RepID=UPI00344913F3